MKLSEYHSSHGLQGQLKLTQSGQTLDFHFHKGEDRLHISAIIAGVHAHAWLVAEKIPTENPDDDRDMRLSVMIQPAPMADAMEIRRQEASRVELPRPAAQVAAPPPVVPAPVVVAPPPTVMERVRVVLDVDGMPMAAGGDMNDHAPEENREPVMAAPTSPTQPVERWEQPNEVPFVGLNADPKPSVEPSPPNDGVVRSIAKDAAAAQALGGAAPSTVADDDAAMLTPPHFGPGPTNPGEVNRSVRGGMVQMERMSGNVEQEAPRKRRQR